MPRLSRITIYPVKALPGVDVDHAMLTARGGLVHDREYAIVDASGNFINGKRSPRVHQLDVSCAIQDEDASVTLRAGSAAETFVLGDRDEHRPHRTMLEARLTQYFGEPVRIERDADGGFPDDLDYQGPTVISDASLIEVAGWYPGLTEHDMRRRFRANLEFSDCPAFWEDQLYGDTGETVAFQIGEVRLLGVNPCQRCVVPTRDPATGVESQSFQRRFIERRHATLPAWVNRSRFDFYYRLAVNTVPADAPSDKMIRLGDEVRIIRDAQ
jgi:uncharacterized protein YcbX